MFPVRKFLSLFYLFAFYTLAPLFAYAQTAPQTFTLDGRLFSDTNATIPLVEAGIGIKIQILNPNQDCVLYEESQTVDTSASNGSFTVQVGSLIGAAKRTSGDSGHAMSSVYSNILTNVTGKLLSNGTACTYSPVSGDQRYVRITVTPISAPLQVLSPNLALDSVPFAIVAESADTLQGLPATQFLQVNNTAPASLTQANLENIFSTTNFPRLQSLLSVPPANYLQSGTNGSVSIPQVSGSPGAGLAAGQFWYDSSANNFKFYNGSSVQTLGVSGAGLSSLTVGSNLTANGSAGGTLNAPGTIDLSTTGVGAGVYTKVTVDAYGRVTSGSQITGADIGTASGDLTGSYPGPSIAPNAVTTSKISNDSITSAKIASTGIAVNRLVATDATTGTTLTYFTCPSVNQILSWTATGWACTNASSLSAVTSVAGKTGAVTLNAADISGLGNAATQNYGTGANNLVQLNASAQLPALDGSLLTNINATRIQSYSVASTAPTAGQVLGFNGSTSQWEPRAASGGSVTNIATSTGLLGGPITSTGTLSVDVGVTASKIPQLNGSAQLALGNGSATAPTYSFTSSTNTGLYSPGANSLALSTNGNAVLTVSSTGYVGIGASSPNVPLETNGIIRSTRSGVPGQYAEMGSEGGADLSFRAVGGGKYLLIDELDSGTSATSNNFIAFRNGTTASPVERLRIDQSGNVGIGTISPQAALDVAATGTAASAIIVPRDTTANRPSTGINGMIRYNTNTAALEGYINGAWTSLATGASGASQWTTLGSIIYYNTGNVGIGTTNPSYKLDVAGSISSSGASASLYIGDRNNSSSSEIFRSSNKTHFYDSALADQMVLDNSTGSLGVGTASPNARFHVLDGSGWTNHMLITNNDFVSGSVGSGLSITNGNASGNTYSAIQAFGAGNSNQQNLILNGGGGNVGVGTTAPQAALDVTGTGTASSAIIVPRDTTANRPSAAVNGMIRYNTTASSLEGYVNGAWTSLTTSASGASQWSTSGLNIYYNSGNVGIGTTSPAHALSIVTTSSNGNALDIQNISSSGYSSATVYDSGGTAQGGFGFSNTGASLVPGNVYLASLTSTPVVFATNSTERLRITGAGNVGIGTLTPAATLNISGAGAQIYDDSFAASNPGFIGRFARGTQSSPTAAQANDTLNFIGARGYGATGFGGASSASISFYAAENFTDTAQGGYITLNTQPTGTAGGASERVRVTAGGSVGISNSNPQALLDVGNGQIFNENYGSNGNPAYIGRFARGTQNVPTAAQANDTLNFIGARGYGATGFAGGSSAGITIAAGENFSDTAQGGYMAFSTQANGASNALTERMRITHDGNVGIGTTLPQAGLDVSTTGTLASAIIVPRDTTANRPSTAVNGMIRYNTNTASLEAYANGTWSSVAGASAGSYLPLSGGTATGRITVQGMGAGFLALGGADPAAAVAAPFMVPAATTGFSSTTPVYSFWYQASTGITNPANGAVGVIANGTEAIRVNSSGFVGIGTTSPRSTLDVGTHRIIASYFNLNDVSDIYDDTGTGGNITLNASSGVIDTGWGNAVQILNGSGGVGVKLNGAGNSYFNVGNVGIGTAAPSNTLDVAGVGRFSGGANPTTGAGLEVAYQGSAGWILSYDRGASAYRPTYLDGSSLLLNTQSGGYVGIGRTAPSNLLTVWYPASNVVSNSAAAFGSNTTGGYVRFGDATTPSTNSQPAVGAIGTALVFATAPNGQNATDGSHERLRIDSAGNVGIGTTAPTQPLEVMTKSGGAGILASQFSTDMSPASILGRKARGTVSAPTAVTSGDFLVQYGSYVYDGTSWLAPGIIAEVVSGPVASGSVPVDFVIGTGTSGAGGGTERLRVTSSGNVGIGTTAPAVALDVNGTVKSIATSNSTATIDFSTGNFQYTSTSCGAMTLNNMKSGATYTLAVQGTAGGTCSFTAWTGSGTGALTVKAGSMTLTQTANKHAIFTFLVMGSYVYVAAVDGY